VGFDSADDRVQRINGLGTTRLTHLRAAMLLKQAGIRIQAGVVLGCKGESPQSLAATLEFCGELHSLGNVDLFHASPLSVLAGSGAFRDLSVQMPEIQEVDYLDPDLLQREWLARFCPALGTGEDAQRTVRQVADAIGAMGRLRSGFGGGRRVMSEPCAAETAGLSYANTHPRVFPGSAGERSMGVAASECGQDERRATMVRSSTADPTP